MPRYLLILLTTGLLCLTLTARAQISLDGTLGKSGALPGPDYQIGADLGQQHGGNLFHSFRDFNLQSHESATFSGPANVQNVISRVTGGNPSSIDGTLRSTIPNADMYFLNPYGIMFGPNAKLDVQGSFHASTADYLRLQDGGRFEARVPGNSLLTVAPVAAFGFLTEAPGEIRLQDSKLSVSEGKTLSLIGGDLHLTGSQPYTVDETGELKFNAELLAPGGRINLASVASQGEVIPTNTDLSLSQVVRRGTILAQNAQMDTSGKHGGSVFIRGGQFELTGGGILNQTKGNQNGGSIDIQVDNLKLWQGSLISSSTSGTGNAGSVVIKADTVEAAGYHELGNVSNINSRSAKKNSGNAGTVTITARQLTLTDGAQISSSTAGRGQGGNIHLQISDILTVSGQNAKGNSSGVFASSNNQELENAGKAGSIEIEARQIVLTNGGRVRGDTSGTGQGGSLTLKVADNLTLTGNGSYITANSNGTMSQAGKAGDITIQAHQVSLTDGAQINSVTRGPGQGGTIYLQLSDTLTVSGQDAEDYFSGIHASSNNQELENAGNAGSIEIEARQIVLTNGGTLNSGTSGTGQGGSVILKVTEDLTMVDAYIAANSVGIMPRAGNAGNLTIQARQVNVANGAQINSVTKGRGQGGVISIKTDSLTVSGLNKLGTGYSSIGNGTASTEDYAGDGGIIEIEAHQINITEGGRIINVTLGSGNSGSISIVTDTLIASGSPDKREKVGDSGIYGVSLSKVSKSGNSGNITIKASQIMLDDGTKIASGTAGAGKGGNIVITTDTLTVMGNTKDGSGSGITTDSYSTETYGGKAGSINVEARQISLIDGAQISSTSHGGGEGGTVNTKVSDILVASGEDKAGLPSGIFSNSQTDKGGTGDAGNIDIQAHQVTLKDGAVIASDTNGSGKGGSIAIKVEDSVTASGNNSKGTGSGVLTNSRSTRDYGGIAGNIKIETRQMTLRDGAWIASNTEGSGEGGLITIKVTDALSISGKGKAGNPSGILAISFSEESYAGNAGEIFVQAGTINLTSAANINTAAKNATGGNIRVITPSVLYLQKGVITTSVAGGTGNGGNIQIDSPVFLVLDKAKIVAQADEGKGGNITITANHRVSSKPENNNVIDATSRKNISGNVVIKAQEEEVGGTLTILPAILKNYDIIKKRCTTEKIADRKKRSKFVKTGRGGVSDAPTQLRSGSVMDITKEQLW